MPTMQKPDNYNFIDLEGQTFGWLTVVEVVGRHPKRGVIWRCECACGSETTVCSSDIRRGNVRSCGCKKRELHAAAIVKHGRARVGSRDLTYSVWLAIRRRCNDPAASHFDRYGGNGIKVCDRWQDSFENFLKDMGERPGPEYSIDRYPDKNGNYQPGNCRWATAKEQARNRRDNVLLTLNGETKTLAEWAELSPVGQGVIRDRLRRGWSLEEAIFARAKYNGRA